MSAWPGVTKHLVRHHSECVCKIVSGWLLTFELYWVKQTALPNMGGPRPTKLKVFLEHKGWPSPSKREFLLSDCGLGAPVFSCLWTQTETSALLGSWACQSSDYNLCHWLSLFSGLQYSIRSLGSPTGKCRSWDFSVSIITWSNSL